LTRRDRLSGAAAEWKTGSMRLTITTPPISPKRINTADSKGEPQWLVSGSGAMRTLACCEGRWSMLRRTPALSQLSDRRAAPASTGALQQFLIKLLHDLRLAVLFLRAQSNAASPFGALHLGFGRLVVEAVPYVADACWRCVRHTCLLRKCGPSGKQERAEQSYCRNKNGSAR
jgi:hypothetical protein